MKAYSSNDASRFYSKQLSPARYTSSSKRPEPRPVPSITVAPSPRLRLKTRSQVRVGIDVRRFSKNCSSESLMFREAESYYFEHLPQIKSIEAEFAKRLSPKGAAVSGQIGTYRYI